MLPVPTLELLHFTALATGQRAILRTQIGFGPRASYTCVYTPINEAKPQVTLKAKFVDARTLYCDTVMATDAKNPFYAALVKNSNYNVQV